MPAPYSLDLRQRVLAAVDAKAATRDAIAARFDVSTAWIRRLVQRRRQTGAIAPLPHRGGPAPALGPDHRDRLRELVADRPDATLAELRDRLAAPVGIMTVARALKALRLPLKKSRTGRPSRTGRMSPGSGPSTGPRSRASTRAG
jgi:transposase